MVTVTTTAFTIQVNDLIILVDDDTAGAAVTITLPTAASGNKHRYTVKKLGTTAPVTIDGNLSETIDDELTQVIGVQYDAVKVVSDGTKWWIV